MRNKKARTRLHAYPDEVHLAAKPTCLGCEEAASGWQRVRQARKVPL